MGCRKIMYEYDNNEQKKACLSVVHTIFSTEEKGGISKKRYRYNGKEKDEESGLYYYGMRYYAPWLCRFTAVDPMSAKNSHQSSYVYADNSPITYIDVMGADTNNNGGGKKSGRAQSRSNDLAKRNKTTEKIESKGSGSSSSQIVREIDLPTIVDSPLNAGGSENIKSGVDAGKFLEPAASDNTNVNLDKTNPLSFESKPDPQKVKQQEQKKALEAKLTKMAKDNQTTISHDDRSEPLKAIHREKGMAILDAKREEMYMKSYTPFEQNAIGSVHAGAEAFLDVYSPAAGLNLTVKGSKALTRGLKFAVAATEDIGKQAIKKGDAGEVNFVSAIAPSFVKNSLLSESITSSFSYTLNSGFKTSMTDRSMTPDSADVGADLTSLLKSQLLKPLKKQ